MDLLISNDDGVFAPGIKALSEGLKNCGDTLVVAPLEERSTTGHTLSLDNPLRMVEISPGTFGCSGYPADCTLMGLDLYSKKKAKRPDLVVSGINRGANLGQDIYYSGTVAAAREAAFHGIPSIAVSSVIGLGSETQKGPEHFSTAAEFINDFVQAGAPALIKRHFVININVPNVERSEIQGVALAPLGFRHYSEEISKREDFRGRPYYWVGGVYKGHLPVREEKTDCFLTENNFISISLLNLLSQPTDNTEEWKIFLKDLNW